MSHQPSPERHPLLQPLSSEHEQGLLLCSHMRRALADGADHAHVLAECRSLFNTDVLPHFAVEEEVVFPVLGNDDPLVQRAIAEHRTIAQLFFLEDDPRIVLGRIVDELEAHIRFEERVLFPRVQQRATPEEMERIDSVHGSVKDNFPTADDRQPTW
jgi:iron-sulfur cluster repair protein YtfE (RIC family)